jgi:ribosomal protein S18 acetylase RimI-like enzyme
MNLEIRPYREGDREAVSALWRRVFPDAPVWNIPEADIDRKLSVQRELFLVAVVDHQVAGTAMGGFDGHRGWVYYVAVTPEHRNKGIGRALMQGVESGLSKLGCPKINLQVRTTNSRAVSFYRRLGYQIENRISMSKRLDK